LFVCVILREKEEKSPHPQKKQRKKGNLKKKKERKKECVVSCVQTTRERESRLYVLKTEEIFASIPRGKRQTLSPLKQRRGGHKGKPMENHFEGEKKGIYFETHKHTHKHTTHKHTTQNNFFFSFSLFLTKNKKERTTNTFFLEIPILYPGNINYIQDIISKITIR